MSYQEEQDFTNERVDPKLWKRLYAYAWRNKKTFIMTIVCLLYVALADSLYPLLANYAVDSFIIPGKSDGVWLFLIMYVALAFSQGFGTLGFITRCGKMEMTISYDIRQDGFLKLQNQSFAYYDKTAVGYLMARMISDVSRLSEMVAWSMVDLLWSSCYALLCLIIMLIKNWKLALLVLVVVPPLAIVAFFMERAILKYQREARKHNSRITGAFNEGIMGAMTTKTLVYEEDNAKEFKEITGSMRKASIKAALINAAFFPLVISLGAVGTSLALYLGGKGVLDPGHAFIGEISAGTLVAFITYAASLFDPIQQFASIFADFQSAQASAERVIGLIDAPIEVQDRPEVVAQYGDVIHPKRENWEPITGSIRFEHVDFAYNPEEPVLTDFNLDIQAGQTIALVGETGAGKSTIVNLVCRFYEPTAGTIYIDGKDYRTRSQLWLQSSLGYVLQSPHLFSGTIADNIRYGRGQHPLRPPRRHHGGGAARGPAGPRGALHPGAGQGLRHGGGRRRHPPVHGPEAAHLLRPGHPGRPPHLRAGRGHQLHRRGDGAAHPGGHHHGPPGPHQPGGGPPALHHPQRGPHPGHPRRPDPGERHPRGASRPGRLLPRPIRAPV